MKAQVIHDIATEQLKHGADMISSRLADLVNYIPSDDNSLQFQFKRKMKTQHNQLTTEESLSFLSFKRCLKRITK